MTSGKQLPDIDVKFRLVRAAEGPCEGLALCMPNMRGPAVVGAYAKAKLLPGHDLWACDTQIPEGSSWDDHFWPGVAQVIAAQIEHGRAPRPTVLIGFSVGGYVAWLVARMLANLPDRPRSLIALDTFPLHYSARGRVPGLVELLQSLPPLPMPLLDVRRARPGPFSSAAMMARGWDKADGEVLTVPVATLEHGDVVQYPVLTRLAPYIEDYVTTGAIDLPCDTPLDARESVGGKVWALLHSVQEPDLETLRELLADDGNLDHYEVSFSLLFLVFAQGSIEEAKAFCDKLWRHWPTKLDINFPRYLLKAFARRKPVSAGVGAAVLPDVISIPSRPAYELALQLRDGSFRLSPSERRALRLKALLRAAVAAAMDYKAVYTKLQWVTLAALRSAQEKFASLSRRK